MYCRESGVEAGRYCSCRANVDQIFRAIAISPQHRRFSTGRRQVHGAPLARIGLWKLALMEGDSDETCEIRSCDQAAIAVLVIFYPYGSASIKFYCSEH